MSKCKRCFDVISSAYYFYVKTKILTDFQIAVTCIFEIVTVLEMCFFHVTRSGIWFTLIYLVKQLLLIHIHDAKLTPLSNRLPLVCRSTPYLRSNPLKIANNFKNHFTSIAEKTRRRSSKI